MLSLLGGMVTLWAETKRQKRKVMWEKQLELLSDLSVFFYNMLTFVGENSQARGECESLSSHSDEELGREIGAQWRSIEPRLWLLDKTLRERVYDLHNDVCNRGHCVNYKSVLDEVEAEIDQLRDKLF